MVLPDLVAVFFIMKLVNLVQTTNTVCYKHFLSMYSLRYPDPEVRHSITALEQVQTVPQ